MNPFITTAYKTPEYFCDRETELNALKSALQNGRNTTLISLRKMGKTGLIHHLFHHLRKEKTFDTVYVDLFHTENLQTFINTFGSAVLNNETSGTQKVKSLVQSFLKSMRPTVTFDPLDGTPKMSFLFESDSKGFQTLNEIFDFLEKRSLLKPIIIALDEFQQIATYPEKNMEATLRSRIQRLNNVRFIFSGSNRHLLSQMFSNTSRPFYQSTDFLHLTTISDSSYSAFIKSKFEENKRRIQDNTIGEILNWTRTHTYYVQYVCNRLFATNSKNIDNEILNNTLLKILEEYELVYSEYRNLITTNQWKLLRAIAKEEGFTQLTSADFMKKHGLTNSATVRRNIETLTNNDMLYKESDVYFVYDPFFAQWLKYIY